MGGKIRACYGERWGEGGVVRLTNSVSLSITRNVRHQLCRLGDLT